MIASGTIVNEDVNASAAIAGTKISPDFGSQNVVTTGTSTAASFIPTSSSVPTNGVYLPSANNVAISTNGAQALYINADGDILVADGNRMEIDEIRARDGAGLKLFDDGGAGIFIEDGGNVGLGTSSPDGKLTIQSSGNSTIVTNWKNSSGTNIGYFYQDGTGNGSLYINDSAAAEKISLNSNGASYFTGGSLGIGSTAPSNQLSIGSNGISTISLDWISDNAAKASYSANHATGEVRNFAFTNYFPTFYSNNSEAARIDNSGRLLIGTSTARGNVNLQSGDRTPQVQIETAVNSYNNGLSIINNSADGFAPQLSLGLSLANSIGSNTNVAPTSPAVIGMINFVGNDGDQFLTGVRIEAATDAATGNGDMPCRLVFSVTADGSASPTEALRISNDRSITVSDGGNVVLGTTTGTKIGTATTQKLGFYNATPVVQPAAVADATTAVDVITQLNDLLAKLRTLGIIAT
jgi:hypothetical protein